MNKLRLFVFTLLLFGLIAAGVPVSDSLAKWGRRSTVSSRKKFRNKRHSRAWWRRYRARMRARRERRSALARKMHRLNALQKKGLLNASQPRRAASPESRRVASLGSTGLAFTSRYAAPLVAETRVASSAPTLPAGPQSPSGPSLPHTWSATRASGPGEMKFVVSAPDGRPVGSAVLSPVAVSAGNEMTTMPSPRAKSIGATSLASLRRTVIDRMVAEGGWVTNDVVREIKGRRVFVVTAQTGGGQGAAGKAWTFYFAEINGRVYSLVTSANTGFGATVSDSSEQVMNALLSGDASITAIKR
jgi:hypothetical protein